MKNVFMRTLLSLVLILAVFLPGTKLLAQTQLDCITHDDVLAMYFDNFDINATVGPFVQFNVYFSIVNATEPSLIAFEFREVLPAEVLALSTTLPTGAINILSPPNFVVGLQDPLFILDPSAVLMSHTLMAIDSNPHQFFLSPISTPSIPGQMAYADGADSSHLVPMYPISGDFSLPVAQINGPALDYCPGEETLLVDVNISFDGDTDNIAGTSALATDGFDSAFDFPDLNTSLTFPHPEWSQATDYFRHDIRAPFDPTMELKQWTFVATAQAAQSSGGRQVTLGFQSSNIAPDPGVTYELLDRTTGSTYDLFAIDSLAFFIPDGTSFNHTFDIFLGNESPVPPSLWVDVTAVSGSLSEATNHLSTSSLATDGYDAGLDIPEPIHPPANYVSSSFIHETWPLGPRFRTDARALFDPTTETKAWGLRVETDQSGTVVLNFAAGFAAEDNIGLQLRDLQSGETFNIFPQMNYAFTANGLSSYDFEIVLGAALPPVLNPTSRPINAGWALIGFPLEPAGSTLNQAIWDQAPGYAFIFDHQPGQGYNLLEPTTTASQNQGYWLATDTGFTWTMTGNRNLSGQTVDLTPGWNLVGNPLWFPGPFEGLAVISSGVTISWQEAVTGGLVATGVQSYDQHSGHYFDAVDLQPWQGYWIDALQSNLQLVFNWENFQILPARLTADKSTLPRNPDVWSTNLTLWDANRQQTSITIGLNPEATEGFDSRFDMPLPPAPPSGGSVFAFTRPEWDLASGAYFSRDVMAPSDKELTWNAVVSVEKPGAATLIWDSSNWPDNADFQLYLPSENRVIVMSMRNQSNVRLDLGEEPLPLVIRTPNMVSGVEDTPALTYRVGVYPNPFNPMTTVSFDLPQAGTAEIRLYSLRGELVNVLGGERYPVGSHKLVWQGKDRSGRNVPSGSYFAKLYVDGRAMGPVTKMSLVR